MISFFLSLWKMILYFKSCFDELCVRIITAISCGNFWCWMHPFSIITSSAISQSRVYFPAGFKKENLKKKTDRVMFLFRKVKQLAFWSYWSSVVSNNNKRISASEDSFVLQLDIYICLSHLICISTFSVLRHQLELEVFVLIINNLVSVPIEWQSKHWQVKRDLVYILNRLTRDDHFLISLEKHDSFKNCLLSIWIFNNRQRNKFSDRN